jgi:hypothetical protein
MTGGRAPFARAGYRSLAARSLSRLVAARAALGGFVRGFVGAASLRDDGSHDHSGDAASARAALSEAAARRGRCC